MKRSLVLVMTLTVIALLFAAAPVPALAEAWQGNIYVVQPGDTLASIAARYCMGWQELYNLNQAVTNNPNQLYPGMQLRIVNHCGGSVGGGGNCGWGGVYDRGPRWHAQGYVSGKWYVVARGDTAFSISQRFGISTYALAQANHINAWRIYAGQRLVIPGYSGGYVGYPCQPPNPIPPVYPIPITPIPPIPSGGVTYTTYGSGACMVTVISGQPYYGGVGAAGAGTFPAVGTYAATRGGKLNNQLWLELVSVPSTSGLVWTPLTGVSSMSPACWW